MRTMKLTLKEQKHYAVWLWLLLGLFGFRVLEQWLQSHFALPLLPAFERWQGSSLPYGTLLASQLLILLLFATIAWRFSTGRVAACPLVGVVMLSLGGFYFSVMFVRLVLGFTVLSHPHWFASHLPALFHLILASFLLLVGHFHWRNRKTGCQHGKGETSSANRGGAPER
jgi:hypothetical protein